MNKENIDTVKHGSNIARADIDGACKWHIYDIYVDEEQWHNACDEYKNKLPQLKAMQGTLQTAENILAALKLNDELGKLLEKIYAYARLQQDADNTDQHLQALAGEAEALAAEYNNANSFIESEIVALGSDTLNVMLEQTTALGEYKFYINNLLRLSKHVLSAEKEAVFAQSQLATGTAAAAFRALVSADMQFPEVKDAEGKIKTVSEGNYLLNMTSSDRELRKNSFKGLMGTYHKFRNTLAATLTGSARTAYFFANVHNYKDTLEAALAGDNIPTTLYDGLINVVHENFTPLHEYMQLKKDLLGYEQLHAYDIYVPISSAGDSFAYSFTEACTKVEEALKPLGKEYIADLHYGMTNGWIDIYENKGKRSGAYSWGVYGVHPFVLLNYQPRYNSMSTIAHEMGHAMHSYYSSKAQTYINSDYTIFCAEVASTTNEILLLEHMLNNSTDEQKVYLLTQFLEAVRTTVYRQVQFAEFEKYIHSEITAGRSLQAEKLEEYWLQINKDYYGLALTVDNELASEWSRIPHFYTPFYVYKYATGYSAATAFAHSILNDGSEAVAKYHGFLQAGGSDYSLKILQKAGVDLNTPKPVTVTLHKFADKLKELKDILGR